MAVIRFIRRLTAATAFYAGNHFAAKVPSFLLRRLYYRHVLGINLQKTACLHMDIFITGRNISIGHQTVINRRCYLDGRGGGLMVGDNVSISQGVHLLTLEHDPDSDIFEARGFSTKIDDYAWIGSRATILPGVTVGHGAVVGAGSVVTGDIGPLEIAAGNPARFIRKRACHPNYNPAYKPFFDTDIDLVH